MIGIEERNAVMRVIDRGVLSGYQGNWSDAFYGGEEVKALEKEWCEYFKVKHAIVCNSATSGLWLACAAIGLQSKINEIIGLQEIANDWNKKVDFKANEVIVTPYSMTCSASIPLHFGAKPVFADIEEDYYCLDPHSVEQAITSRTRAIIVVDIFGQPYNAKSINRIAARLGRHYGHKIYVIEDAAQAIGAKYEGRYAGTLGDIGVFSLNRHKHIQCGEGGVVVTDNDELAFKIRMAMNHSEAVVNDIQIRVNRQVKAQSALNIVGMNMRMTELQAAVAREQLKKLDGILQTVREHANYFPVKIRPECDHAFYRYAVNKYDSVDEKLVSDEIDVIAGTVKNNRDIRNYNFKRHYITPIYKMPLFQSLGYADKLCPVCEEVEENIVLAWLKGMG